MRDLDFDRIKNLVNTKSEALDLIRKYGGIDGAHHKDWVLDQVVRILTCCPKVKKTKTGRDVTGKEYEYTFEVLGESSAYLKFVASCREGKDGPYTYDYEIGIAP